MKCIGTVFECWLLLLVLSLSDRLSRFRLNRSWSASTVVVLGFHLDQLFCGLIHSSHTQTQVPVATSHRARCWPDFFTPNTETSMDTFADKPIPISCTVNAVGSCWKAASHPFTRANPRSDICSCCNFSSKGYIKFLQQLMTFNIGTLRAWEQNGEEKRKVGVQVPRGFITI